jgi:hypothetical protein
MLLVYILDIVHMPHILSLKTLRLALQLTHAVFDNKLTP